MTFRPDFGFLAITAVLVALLHGLGVWQLERREWKLGLIDEIEAKTAATPVPLWEVLVAETPDAAEFRPVTVSGRFLHDREAHVFSHRNGQAGFLVFTPLELSGAPDRVVYVNRGFVPTAYKDPSARPGAPPEGEVTVKGLVRPGRPPQGFTPEPDPAANVWYGRDIAAMAQAGGITGAAPLYVDVQDVDVQDVDVQADGAGAGGSGAWPQPVGGPPELRNNHLNYAITWFTVALIVIAMATVYHVQTGRLSFGSANTRPDDRA